MTTRKEYRLKYKTFIQYFEYARYDSVQLKKLHSDKRLTNVEKDIIGARILMRQEKYQESMRKIPREITSCLYLESHRLLCLGTIYSQSGDMILATPFLEKARKLFNQFQDHDFEAVAILNLFFNFFNQKKFQALMSIYPEMLVISEKSSLKIKLHIQRAKALYLSLNVMHEEALHTIDQVIKQCKGKAKADLPYALMVKLDILVKAKRFPEALELLFEYKKHQKLFYSASNYNFCLILLENLVHDRPLYSKGIDKIKQHSINFIQISFLRAFSSGELVLATNFWNQLAEMSTEVYLDRFCYKGDPCLFSFVLEKYNKSKLGVSFEGKNKLELLKNLLETSSIPLSKEKLIQTLWPEEKADCSIRFNTAISRLRKDFGLSIKKERGGYFLLAKAS